MARRLNWRKYLEREGKARTRDNEKNKYVRHVKEKELNAQERANERARIREEATPEFQRKEKRARRKRNKQEGLERKAESGDPFAQSTLERQNRQNKTAERIGRRRAWNRFRTPSGRKAMGVEDTKEGWQKALRSETAKAGNSIGGAQGGERAVEAFDQEQKQRQSELRKKRTAKKEQDARMAKAQEQKARRGELRKRRFDLQVKQNEEGYKRNPALADKLMDEGTLDLVEKFKDIQKGKHGLTGKDQALKDLASIFNQLGDTTVKSIEDRNGSLYIHGEAWQKDPQTGQDVLAPFEQTIDKAQQKAILNVGGRKRAELYDRSKELKEEERKAKLSATAKAEQQKRDLEKLRVSAGLRAGASEVKAGREAQQEAVELERETQEKAVKTGREDVKRVAGYYSKRVATAQKKIDDMEATIADSRATRKSRIQAEKGLESAKKSLKKLQYQEVLSDPALTRDFIAQKKLKYPNTSDESILRILKKLATGAK